LKRQIDVVVRRAQGPGMMKREKRSSVQLNDRESNKDSQTENKNHTINVFSIFVYAVPSVTVVRRLGARGRKLKKYKEEKEELKNKQSAKQQKGYVCTWKEQCTFEY